MAHRHNSPLSRLIAQGKRERGFFLIASILTVAICVAMFFLFS